MSEEVGSWAEVKRLIEQVSVVSENLSAFQHSPEKFLQRLKLALIPSYAQEMVEVSLSGRRNWEEKIQENPYLQQAKTVFTCKDQEVKRQVVPSCFASSAFYEWQIRRKKMLALESAAARRQLANYCVPIAFELSDGCTGRCAFCCLDPQPLKRVFRYTEKNRKLWREVLQVAKEEIGEAAGAGACYFATEPFDNPDYERFVAEFQEVFRTHPQTTTVKSVANVLRMKRFMEQLGEEQLQKGKLRFSVVSLAHLEKIYAMYSVEELANVELVLNNPESIRPYSYSGRARELQWGEGEVSSAPSACLIGFLVNLCAQTISLVAPRAPSARYPLGMEILSVKNFSTSGEFRAQLKTMSQTYMSTELSLNCSLGFHETLSLECKGTVVTFWGDRLKQSLSLSSEVQRVLKKICENCQPISAIFQEEQFSEFLCSSVLRKLQELYASGFLRVVCEG